MSIIRLYEDIEEARREILGKRGAEAVDLPQNVRERIRAVFGEELSAAQAVERILGDVRSEGDAAVRRYTRALDGVDLADPLVPPEELDAALESVAPELRSALEVAAERIRRFHEHGRRTSWLDFSEGGALGQLIVPIERVGIYTPGGRAAYPSTVLMAAVPARVAGVRELVVATPPRADGTLTPSILAAARVAGVDRVYRVGGAQAIAALAFGTERIPRVDKIVGPGNLFVILAKQAVAGAVGVDGLPGPTETVVVADERANPGWIAADMLAQAEHDPLAQSLLLCCSRPFARAVVAELERQLAEAPRAEIIREALRTRGAVVVTRSVDEAVEFANDHAPEHLCLSVADPWQHLGKIRNAGGVFMGEGSVEAIGDYTAGPSHIMPTGGTARFASPLNLDDFIKVVSVFSFGPDQLRTLGEPAAVLARAEGLAAHAAAIEARLDVGGWGLGVRGYPRAAVEHMAPYTPPDDPAALAARAGVTLDRLIKLDANENPYGPAPRVAEALAEFGRYHWYPDPEASAIRPLVAAYAGVDPERVLLGNGSDELIDLLCRIYLEPGEEVLDCTPTFGMYRFSTELCGGQPVEVPRTAQWQVDPDRVRNAITPRTKLIFIATPNNPSGNRESEEVVRELLETGLMVVLDEAYVEFSRSPSFARLVAEAENLVVLRTFSKWAGLAGLRVGYGVFPLGVIRPLWKVKPPFNLNLAAEVAVRATLEDQAPTRRSVELIIVERDRMARRLEAIEGLRVWPSEANFLLVEVEGDGGAADLKANLAARGIAVRAYGHPRLANAVRISVGLPEHTDALIAAIQEWRNG